MELSFFVKGVAIGFSIAAPVGPIGVLCIRRSLADGAWKGFAAGLGAATADAAYGGVAGFGLTAVSSFLVLHQAWLGLVGGAFLSYLGIRTFRSKPAQEPPRAGTEVLPLYGSTLLLTLANPATILSFAAVFSVFGLGISADYLGAAALVLGVFLGSALWWLVLCGGVGLLRSRVTPAWMQAVNRASGAVLLAFGICALGRSLA
ncbi:MAG TPA: LysE family transporter [Opitutaceae bacterium]|nr:LysE family transporter [Opitutaceae bacterium]